MISSTLLIKCTIAIILLLQASSAFVMPSDNVGNDISNSFFSTIISGKHIHDIRCYATDKRENCPGKTAFKSKNRIPGVGGMNYGQKKGNTQITTKKVITKNTTKKVMKSTNKTKISSNKSSSTPKADIDWPTIIAGFLTPWRNPNSIFLYMLIILTVLGKYNEANP